MRAQTLGDTSSVEFMRGRRILEINPDHPIIKDLNAACKNAPDSTDAKRAIELLYDTALISSGFTPDSPAELGNKIYEMMAMALGGRWGRLEDDSAEGTEDDISGADVCSSGAVETEVVELSEMDRRLVHLIVLCTLPCLFISTRAAQKPLTPALFIFGDSIVDGGNNNNLKTKAVANYPPNGIDFPGKAATGRFTNGYTIADLFDKMLNLPLALPYVSTKHVDRLESTSGYNYASSSAGILPETGSYLGKNLDMRTQVKLFQESIDKYIREQFRNNAALRDYLANSVFLIHIGTNDYLGNYLQPDRYNTSRLYKPDEYADFLAKILGKNLKDLYNLGARKFVVFQISRIGCYPELVEKFKPKAKCAENVNDMVTLFNKKMEYQLGHLTFILRRSYFMTANVYNLTRDILDDPYRYGLTETRRGCCQDQRFNCLRRTVPCKNRDSYYFWDRFHPSQAVNKIITKECFNNFKVCYPMNIYRLLQI